MPAPKPPVKLDIMVERITPEDAENYLKANEHNRKISTSLVHKYAEAMANGEWRLNGEAIIFSNRGILQSGQHRLLAVVEADTPIWSVVVRGAEPEALFSLDSGRKRSLLDALRLRGEKDVAHLATAVTWLWRYQAGAMDRRGETATTTHLLKVLEAHPEIHDHVPVGRRVRGATGMSIGLVAALHWAFTQKDPEDADAFMESLVRQEGLSEGDPVYSLVKWIRRAQMDTSRRYSSTHYAAIIIKAWNAYRDHRTVKTLTYKGSEAFPEIV